VASTCDEGDPHISDGHRANWCHFQNVGSAALSYTIVYRHACSKTTERWEGSLGEVQAKAVNYVRSGAADYVEIRNSQGNLVDCYPAVHS
jgi:hypothetical protein